MRVSGLTWLILVSAVLVLLSTAGQIVGFYTDWLWFGEVQFTSVFVTILRTEILVGLVTGVAFFVILYGNVALAWRLAPRGTLVLAGRRPRAAKSRNPEAVPPPADVTSEHDAGSPGRLAWNGPKKATPV